MTESRNRSLGCYLLLFCLSLGGCKAHAEGSQGSVLDSLEGREPRESKFENGQKKEAYSVVKDKQGNYLKDGPFTSFHQNGQKEQEGAYKSDRPDGHWQRWGEDGKLTLDINYENGKREGAFTVYASGTPTQTGSYGGDELNGPFKYLGFEGLVVSGTMANGKPVDAWAINETSGKPRARASFPGGKLGSVQSLAPDGAPRPALDSGGCAEFAGYALGTLRWADVVFDLFARGRFFPSDAGINKFTKGRMLGISSDQIEGRGIQRITLIFDADDSLTALTASAEKQMGNGAYADAFKQLHAQYAKKYSVISAALPFVGDCHAEYKNRGCSIELDAPHLDFNMSVVLHSAEFAKLFKAGPQ
jgi:hypothetical protein